MANAPDTLRRVQRIVANVYGVPARTVTPETHFGNSLYNALLFAEVMIDCEKEFGVLLPDQAVIHLVTVGELAAHIDSVLHPDGTTRPPPPRATH